MRGGSQAGTFYDPHPQLIYVMPLPQIEIGYHGYAPTPNWNRLKHSFQIISIPPLQLKLTAYPYLPQIEIQHTLLI